MTTQIDVNAQRGFAIHPLADRPCRHPSCDQLGQFVSPTGSRSCQDHVREPENPVYCARCGLLGWDCYYDISEPAIFLEEVAVGPTASSEWNNNVVGLCYRCAKAVNPNSPREA